MPQKNDSNKWISIKANELYDLDGHHYRLIEHFEKTFIVLYINENDNGNLAGEPLNLCTDYRITGIPGERTLVFVNSAWSVESEMVLHEQR